MTWGANVARGIVSVEPFASDGPAPRGASDVHLTASENCPPYSLDGAQNEASQGTISVRFRLMLPKDKVIYILNVFRRYLR